jgi:hypothetical protein
MAYATDTEKGFAHFPPCFAELAEEIGGQPNKRTRNEELVFVLRRDKVPYKKIARILRITGDEAKKMRRWYAYRFPE